MVCKAYGGQPRFIKSRISDLLHQPTISSIHRDKEGILWIGTQQGLHRFDGTKLVVFDASKNNVHWIPDSEIKDVGEDSDGRLLVATARGYILTWNRQSEAFDAVKKNSPQNKKRFIRLSISQSNNIWLLYENGVSVLNYSDENVKAWVENINLQTYIGSARDLVEDDLGDVWIGGDLGVVKLQLQQNSVTLLPPNSIGLPGNANIAALKIIDDRKLVVGTNSGHLVVWDMISHKPLAKAKVSDHEFEKISQLIIFKKRLMISTDRGLYESDTKLTFFSNLREGNENTSSPHVTSLFADENYIWVGTIDGLDILSFAPFELFSTKSNLSHDILAFQEDSRGHIWIGTYSGLYMFNATTKSHLRAELGPISSPISQAGVSALLPRKDEIWLGLIQGGVEALKVKTGQLRTHKSIDSKTGPITKMLETANANGTWIATYNQGLFRTTVDGLKSYYDDQTLPERTINLMFQFSSELLLSVSGNKVYRYNSKLDAFDEIKFNFPVGTKSPLIYSFAQTRNGDILIGTKDHGVFRWPHMNQVSNQFDFQLARFGEPLENSTIYGLELDSEGNYWCATQNGVIKLSPDGKLIKRFTTADGLQGNDFTLGASFKSREGLIYFGGTNGYNRFDPMEVEIDNSPSPMRLTGISLPSQDGRNLGPVSDLKLLQLTHEDHFVTFQFSVLDFIDAERNQFRYKLENFDTDWIENGTNNTATFTNLPPGDYVLLVQGANSAGIWNREGLNLRVKVLPAPWYTWWAYTLYGLVLLCLLWGLHRIYRSYAIDRRSAELALEMFEAENKADDDMQEQLELQDEMVRSAYQHNLTTLGLISDSINLRSSSESDTTDHSLAKSSIDRIAALSSLEDCLSYQAGGPVANLHKYTEGILPRLLARSSVSKETIITINEVTSTPLPVELASPLSIVIYELLENCIQHAFEPESPANYIHIKLIPGTSQDPTAHCFELTVHDSGIGIFGDVEELARKGRGIAVVQAIANDLNGHLLLSQGKRPTISLTIPSTDNR